MFPNCSASSPAVTLCDISSIPFNTLPQMNCNEPSWRGIGISKKENCMAWSVELQELLTRKVVRSSWPRKRFCVAQAMEISCSWNITMGSEGFKGIICGGWGGMGDIIFVRFVVTNWTPSFV